MFLSKVSKVGVFVLLPVLSILSACGGGGGTNTGGGVAAESAGDPEQVFIAGGGIKGPLAFATVNLYKLDTGSEGLYDASSPIATATTDAYAQIDGLAVPADVPPPYVLLVDGTDAIDRNTGTTPVLTKLITIVTRETINAGRPVYATPYTTLAYHMLSESLAGSVRTGGGYALMESGKYPVFSIEAEHPTNVRAGTQANWQPVDQAGGAGAAVMQALPKSALRESAAGYSDSSPRLDYDIVVNDPGVYYVWLRVLSATSSTNSVHFGLNTIETDSNDYIRFPENSGWIWQQIPSVNINTAGVHTLNVWMREAGAIVDKLVLSKDPDYFPAGTGPALSVYQVYGSGGQLEAEIDGSLESFGTIARDSMGYGMSSDIDVLSTAPILSAQADTLYKQTLVVQYRAAIEALSSMVHELALTSEWTSDQWIELIAADLYDDGMLNTLTELGAVLLVLSQDPMAITIANTDYTVGETADLIEYERTLLGTDSSLYYYGNGIELALAPLVGATGQTTLVGSAPSISTGNLDTARDGSSARVSGAGYSPFDKVPVPKGRMQFDWYESAKSRFTVDQADDLVDWPAMLRAATRTIPVNSCASLKAALGGVIAGDMILVDPGNYEGCRVTITRSGTATRPVIIASAARARGEAGEVVFSGGDTFATFRNSASHYIVGGFRFTGQSEAAFDLEDGGIVTGASGATVYEDGSINIRFTENQYEFIGREVGSTKGVILAGVRSHNIRIDHSVFESNYNQIRFKNNKAAGALVSTSKNARIDHNYFGPAAPNGYIEGVTYEISAFQTCCSGIEEDSDTLTVRFEYNVIEHAKSPYSDPEVIEVKTAGMVIESNIIWSQNADVSLRFSHGSRVASNYLVSTGIIVHGANHVVTGNYIDGESLLDTGISMSRWGRRQPANCSTLPPTHSNVIVDNTVIDTRKFGMRIGDCDYGACRPVFNSRIEKNYLQSGSGQLLHFNTRDEHGRTTVCNQSTTDKNSNYDRTGDALGGFNTGISIDSNKFVIEGNAITGSGYSLDRGAVLQ